MTIEIAQVLVTAGALLVGYIAGARAAWRRRPERPPKPVCPCDHAISFHENGTGRCHGTYRRKLYSGSGADLGYRDVPCTCQTYAGPELVSSLTMRPIALRSSTDLEPEQVPPPAAPQETTGENR